MLTDFIIDGNLKGVDIPYTDTSLGQVSWWMIGCKDKDIIEVGIGISLTAEKEYRYFK